MADFGKKIAVYTTPEPIPVPQFVPTRREVPAEKELVPVGPRKKSA